MPEYLAPGVYVEEIPSTNKPIQAASTSTAGAVGMTARGPVDRPTLVTSLSAYARIFGGRLAPAASPDDRRWVLPFAVEGFFANGGSRLYVARVVGAAAAAARLVLAAHAATAGHDSILAATANPGQTTLALQGLRLLEDGMEILLAHGPTSERVRLDADPTAIGHVVAHGVGRGYTAAATVTPQEVSAPQALTTAALAESTTVVPGSTDGIDVDDVLLLRRADDRVAVGELVVVGSVVEADGDSPAHLTLRAALRRDYPAGSTLASLTAAGAGNPTLAAAVAAPVDDEAATLVFTDPDDVEPGTVLQLEEDGNTEYVLVNALASTVALAAPLESAAPAGTLASPVVDGPSVHARWPGDWGDDLRATVYPFSLFEGTLAAATAQDDTVLSLSTVVGLHRGSLLAIGGTGETAEVLSVDAEEQAVTLVPGSLPALDAGTPLASQEFSLLIERFDHDRPVESERFDGLSQHPDHPRFAPTIVGDWTGGEPSDAGASNLVRISPAPNRLPLVAGVPLPLEGGTDDLDGVTEQAYLGREAEGTRHRSGIKALQDEPTLSIVAVPGQTSVTIQKALIAHCDLMRYRFAVLDVPNTPDLNLARAHRQNFDSTRAALYYPDVQVANPFGRPGDLLNIPPSGHVAGIYARTDVNRGVHKAPANEVVSNVLSLSTALTKPEQDVLNPIGLNCLRDFRSENRGIRVYGARVATSDPEWKYVNVRRLLLFIEQSLDVGLQWAVFEPNDKALWDSVGQSVTGFLDTVWRSGALEGTTQQEAFFVNIGYDITMSQADIDNGLLVVEVGVAAVKPAEYVVLRISQKTREAIA
jgi:uncharacterized protein